MSKVFRSTSFRFFHVSIKISSFALIKFSLIAVIAASGTEILGYMKFHLKHDLAVTLVVNCKGKLMQEERWHHWQLLNPYRSFAAHAQYLSSPIGGVAQWLGRRSLTGGLFQACARSVVDRWSFVGGISGACQQTTVDQRSLPALCGR